MNRIWLERSREPSTWRGVVMVLTALGITLSPEAVEAVVAVGTGVAGLIGILTREGGR